MLRYGLVALILAVVALTLQGRAGAPNAYAHPGGTDANGCHVCRTNCPSWGIPYGYYHRHYPVRPCFDSSPSVGPSPSPSPLPPIQSVLAPRPQWAAQSCSARFPGRAAVEFNWQAGLAADVQWVDLSLFDNRWSWGTFLGAGPLPGSAGTWFWDGLLANTTHYYRINAHSVAGWNASVTYSFRTISC